MVINFNKVALWIVIVQVVMHLALIYLVVICHIVICLMLEIVFQTATQVNHCLH